MKKFLGLILLIVAVGLVVGYKYYSGERVTLLGETETVTVTGLVGSEKMGFLRNTEIETLLARKYGLKLDVRKSGSVEMVSEARAHQDFLWPASPVNEEMYTSIGGAFQRSESVFHSPIVFYSWKLVTDAFIENGLIQQEGETLYMSEPKVLFEMIQAEKSWKEIGLPQLFGKIIVRSTDPTRSNSGNMYAALLANTLYGDVVSTSDALAEVAPALQNIFRRQGHMEQSSGVLFSIFLEQGVGAYPIVVGYENQLVEFSLENPQAMDEIRQQLRIIYPRPTVWASHPLIAVKENGAKLLTALQDPKIQQQAWEKHGFRSGGIGSQNDPAILKINGLPKSITSVMPTPNAKVMEQMIKLLSE